MATARLASSPTAAGPWARTSATWAGSSGASPTVAGHGDHGDEADDGGHVHPVQGIDPVDLGHPPVPPGPAQVVEAGGVDREVVDVSVVRSGGDVRGHGE